jgi:hypothetical protein
VCTAQVPDPPRPSLRDAMPKHHLPSRAYSAVGDASRGRPARCRAPSTGFFKERPSTGITKGVHSRTPEGLLRQDGATRPARSVFAVPPRPDGFLLPSLRGLVASHIRSWGSPGFGWRPTDVPVGPTRLLPGATPSRASFLPRQPCPRHRGPLPPCRSSRLATRRGSGALLHRGSGLGARRCRRLPRPALLGFPTWSTSDLPDGPRSAGRIPRPARGRCGGPSEEDRRDA